MATPAVPPTLVTLKSQRLDGKWELERKIGEGGMGVVYLAKDLTLERPVAIKILSAAYAQDGELQARFEREARLTASLEHPNIVPVYSVGRFEGRPFIVMKKLEGETLADHLRAKGRLSVAQTLAIARQLCSALALIHGRGFVHRDVKSGNIYLGSDGHLTLLDFGILRQTNGGQALTRAGMVMGTPQYMAPEQALGQPEVDHRADLYAAAIVFFECLTGAVPLDGDNELQIIQLQAHAAPPSILDRAPDVSSAVADMISRALAKLPEARYASASELLAAFEQAASAPMVQAHAAPSKPSTPPRTMTSARRAQAQHERAKTAWRWGRVGIGVFALLAASGVVRVAWQQLGAAASPQPSHEVRTEAPKEPALLPELRLGTPPPPPKDDTAQDGPMPVPVDERISAEPAAAPARHKLRLERSSTGRLKVMTTQAGEPYWAQVSVDGAVRGRTPLVLELQVGSHKVRVERMGFRVEERQVKIASERDAVLRIALSP